MAIRGEWIGPLYVYRCPKCDFPLTVFISDVKHPPEGASTVTVGCSRCCWSESWGSLDTLKLCRWEGAEDGSERKATEPA